MRWVVSFTLISPEYSPPVNIIHGFITMATEVWINLQSFRTPTHFTVNTKILTKRLYQSVIPSNDVNEIGNTEDPDQTAPLKGFNAGVIANLTSSLYQFLNFLPLSRAQARHCDDTARKHWALVFLELLIHTMGCPSDRDKTLISHTINQRTNGPVNAHLISWPSKAQNIQNLENLW